MISFFFFLLLRLFDWLVTFINHQIKVEYFDHNIGMIKANKYLTA